MMVRLLGLAFLLLLVVVWRFRRRKGSRLVLLFLPVLALLGVGLVVAPDLADGRLDMVTGNLTQANPWLGVLGNSPPVVLALGALGVAPKVLCLLHRFVRRRSSPPVAPPSPGPAAGRLPAGAEPRLVVLRGLNQNAKYPIREGKNVVGRADEEPVDIDLEDQEPPDRIWSSRQHACIFLDNGELSIEDLNSSNGTFVNRARIYAGQKKTLNVNDVIQIGTVQLKVVV